MTPAPATPPKQPRYRIAIIQEKENLEDVYKTRTVIGLLPYEESECDRLMRFMSEPYARSRPVATSQPTSGPKFNSADLLLLAHDEWKRREERKHIHDMRDWEAGFINGFLTDKKWARELLDKMYADATLRSHSTTGTSIQEQQP